MIPRFENWSSGWLVALLDHAVTEGFLAPAERALVRVATTVDEALDLLGVADPLISASQPPRGW